MKQFKKQKHFHFILNYCWLLLDLAGMKRKKKNIEIISFESIISEYHHFEQLNDHYCRCVNKLGK
jgi:hypothetical protein